MKSHKILSARALARALTRERKKGRRIVFTNGVYDLLHSGHVTLLQKAKRLGDILVLGLNRDSSVRRLKGPRRPVAPEEARRLGPAAQEPVDYVVVFSEETPFELIKK